MKFECLCGVFGSGRPQRRPAVCFRVFWIVEWVKVMAFLLDDHEVLMVMTEFILIVLFDL